MNETYQRETVIEMACLVAALAMQLPIDSELEDRISGVWDTLVDLLEEI